MENDGFLWKMMDFYGRWWFFVGKWWISMVGKYTRLVPWIRHGIHTPKLNLWKMDGKGRRSGFLCSFSGPSSSTLLVTLISSQKPNRIHGHGIFYLEKFLIFLMVFMYISKYTIQMDPMGKDLDFSTDLVLEFLSDRTWTSSRRRLQIFLNDTNTNLTNG